MSNGRKNLVKSSITLTIVLASLVASSLILTAFADTTIFDNQGAAYWTVYNNGESGMLAASINTSNSVVHSGASSSLELMISSGANAVVGFYHVYSPTVDWSSYSGISFWLYGSNSNGYIYFVVFDKNYHYYLDIIKDNFVGWQQFTLDFATVFASGSVDLSNIYAMEFSFGNPAPSTLYLDQIVLTGGPSATPSASPSTSPTSSPTTSPTVSPNSSPTPAPTKGVIFFPPEPTPITFSSASPTYSTAKPTPVPGSSLSLAVYVVNGTTPVTDGVVTVGATSVSLNSSGIAFFNDLVAARIYHISIVVNGVKVYDNAAFAIPASETFTANLAPKNAPGIFWAEIVSILVVAVVVIIAIILVIIILRKRAKH